MSTHPWFKFFAKEWLLSNFIRTASAEERGVYIQLLAEQWQNGGFLPTDDGGLYRLAACDDREQWERVKCRVLEQFGGRSEDGSEMWNAKLRQLQLDAIALSRDRSEAGKIGNDIKKQKASKRDAIACDLRSQTSRDKDKEEDREEDKEEPFDPSFDGSEAFENSVAIFPTERRDYDPITQKLYFEAIGEIGKPGNLSSSEAVAKLDAASRSYTAKKGEFCVAFSKYLRNGVWRGESAPVMLSVAAIMEAKAKECGVDLNALSAAKREQVTP
jgi:uncharacterized protein YdaU (DUF1376 family)